MKIIAYRKGGLGFLYTITLLVGLAAVSAGIMLMAHPAPIICGGLLVVISAVILFGYFRTPCEAIVLIDKDTLELPGGVNVKLSDISDVSYRRASAKGVQYKWGKVIISTPSGSYKINYLADCEETAKELTQLMYDAKHKSEVKM